MSGHSARETLDWAENDFGSVNEIEDKRHYSHEEAVYTPPDSFEREDLVSIRTLPALIPTTFKRLNDNHSRLHLQLGCCEWVLYCHVTHLDKIKRKIREIRKMAITYCSL